MVKKKREGDNAINVLKRSDVVHFVLALGQR